MCSLAELVVPLAECALVGIDRKIKLFPGIIAAFKSIYPFYMVVFALFYHFTERFRLIVYRREMERFAHIEESLMNAAFQNVPFGRFKNGAIPWLLQEDYYE